jgi:hypothetical protein
MRQNRSLVLAVTLVLSLLAAPGEARAVDFSSEKLISSTKVEPEAQAWMPKGYRFSVGYEAAAALPGAAFSVGKWNGNFGVEILGAYGRSTDSSQESTVESVSNELVATSSKTVTTTYSGTSNPMQVMAAAKAKYRVLQNNWAQVYFGALGGTLWTSSASYQTGTRVATYADRSVAGNYSVSESGIGNIERSTSLQIFVGPLLGSEFYLKWIPHLALGFSTGFSLNVGGGSTTTTAIANKSYTVTGGVAGTPASHTSSRTTVETSPGTLRGTTFGLGGATFALFTTAFTVRYVW